ncbi:MAG: helix-turn-helix domain-containing protein [Gammaproteobacteria bacterium]|jgi:DNA-binding Lrp family transcriptional regulator|nr:helix-turn-helix domain-containing protein [Gammaproteobacteria bacterium]
MIEVSRARHICAHTVKPCFAMTKREIQFVLNFPGLNDTGKLVWMVLASLNEQNPDFTYQYSFQQFAKMLGKSPNSVLRAIKHLEAVGIVQAIGEKETQARSANSLLWNQRRVRVLERVDLLKKSLCTFGASPFDSKGRENMRFAHKKKNPVLINLIRRNEKKHSTFGLWNFLCLFVRRRGRINFGEVWQKIH